MLLEHGISLLNSKVAGKSTTMEFLDKEFSKATFRFASPGSHEKESLLDMKWTVGVARTLDKNLLEIFIFGIHLFNDLKTKHLGLQNQKEEI